MGYFFTCNREDLSFAAQVEFHEPFYFFQLVSVFKSSCRVVQSALDLISLKKKKNSPSPVYHNYLYYLSTLCILKTFKKTKFLTFKVSDFFT